jgi:hypothetical protein
VTAGPGVATKPATAAIIVPTPLAGVARGPASQVLLAISDLPGGYLVDGSPGTQTHPGPGMSSATARFVSGTPAQQHHVYVRVSAFYADYAAAAEFKQEQADIERSSTALPANGQTLGQEWQAYSVDSGSGAASTSSVGLLVRERNDMVNMVLSGAPSTIQLNDLLPLAERQVAKIATAR